MPASLPSIPGHKSACVYQVALKLYGKCNVATHIAGTTYAITDAVYRIDTSRNWPRMQPNSQIPLLMAHILYSSKVTLHLITNHMFTLNPSLLKFSTLDPESSFTIDIHQKPLWKKVILIVKKSCITVNTYYLVYLRWFEPSMHHARFCPACALLCCNYSTYCLFELVLLAKQENFCGQMYHLSFVSYSYYFLCWVLSEKKKWNLEMKNLPRQRTFVRIIA